jgi:hypothetical protein
MGIFGRHRIKRPVAGWAEVVETWRPPQHGASGNCKMKLRLDVPGVEPQIVKYHEAMMNPNRWPEVGMRVAVTVDADHPDRVDADWDSVFGEVMGGVFGSGAQMIAAVAGIDLDLSKGVEGDEPQPDPNYMAIIAELNAQHAAGLITYEEMSAAIQRTMGLPSTP